MTESHIQDVIHRFVWTARKAEELGADGVEIDAAHGYLISQFLSPLSNRRTDRWGGSLENRARLLFEVVRAVRSAMSSKFGVGVKINSADYQRGGFGPDDLTWVATRLNDVGLDLIEISGGSHESPAMTGTHSKQRKSTRDREAYFLEVARKLKEVTTIPLMVTGGIRSKKTAEQVVSSGDKLIVGIGTAIGLMPDPVERWKKGEDPSPHTATSWVLSGKLTSAGQIACVQYNLHRTALGRSTWIGVWPLLAIIVFLLNENSQAKAYRKWAHALKTSKVHRQAHSNPQLLREPGFQLIPSRLAILGLIPLHRSNSVVLFIGTGIPGLEQPSCRDELLYALSPVIDQGLGVVEQEGEGVDFWAEA
ncbi:hypothetical protein PRZ48_006709 [Zasmidium cellare]|uniref:NADH:flavin oxidoreductase/NADH oxidase N-terminal domain-containing protein n=1 Tax=Zasmidium cellare TaxID=395010 RepID=A0ABR0ENV4_ZASCE|nr:hypothetical protein PRZ48_006709 [Zasmidium cellare]